MNPKDKPSSRPATVIIYIGVLSLLLGGTGSVRPPGGAPAPAQTPRDAAIEHNNLGIALLAQFKASDAEKEFRLAIAAAPDYVPALVNVGIAQLAQVRYPEATESFGRALAADPGNVHAHYNLSLIFKVQGKTDEGILHAKAAVAGDGRDPDLHYNLGALHQSARNFDAAIAEYQAALKLDSNLLPAYYSLGRAFISKGDIESGKKYMQKHQELQAASNLPVSSSGMKYGEQGRYSFAMEDLSGRNARVDPLAAGRITFTNASVTSGVAFAHSGGGDPLGLRSPLPAGGNAAAVLRDHVAPFLGSGVGVADVDGDGMEDLIFPNTLGKPAGLFLNRGKMSFEASGAASAIPTGEGMGIAAGDVDNDGDVDLLVTRYGGVALLLGDGKGAFTPATLPALKEGFFAAGASLADIDHDGDLDVFVAGLMSAPNPPRESLSFPGDYAGEEIRVFRNNGNGSFADVTQAARFGDGSTRNTGAVFSDFDNDRDIDVAVARLGQGIALYTNNRDGTFTDIGAKVGLPTSGNYLGIVAVDYNRDGWVDIAATLWDSSVPRLFRNDGSGAFALDVTAVADIPRDGNGPLFGLGAADVDNDGLVDLLAVNGTDSGPAIRLLHNLGQGIFEDATAVSGLARVTARRGRGLAVADLDADGDLDLVISNNGASPTILRNDGGNKGHWLTVTPKGLNSNRQGVGTKVEAKAGTLWQKTEIASGSGYLSSTSLRPFFGLGAHASVDALRLLWPGGVLQDEVKVAADAPLKVDELDRKGTSCPILYTWDGTKIAFVTDFLGGSAFGYLVAPATWNTPDTDEYVRIPADRISPHDGRYELYLVNQLEETIYFDRAQLVAVDHPEGTEAYPDERLVETPPFPGFRMHVVRGAHPAVSAVDDRGRDVTDALAREDRTYPDGFRLLPFKGYAETHALTLDLGAPAAGGAVLLMTAWIDYADSTSNLAASQSGIALAAPSLEALDPATGAWIVVAHDMGFPAGLPKTMIVDLTGKLPHEATKIRITTNMRIYWDRILVATPSGKPASITRLDPSVALLRWRGFPLPVSPDGRAPAAYDYAREDPSIFWKAHEGFYTRYGDVRPLLASADDRYVITRGGDEIAMSFDPAPLPPLAPGMTRTFLLYADGFGKDMDVNSARPDRVEPLPYHAMPAFPYPASAAYPVDDRALEYFDAYNTRQVKRSVTPIGP